MINKLLYQLLISVTLFLTTSCFFDTHVEPEQLSTSISGYGSYQKATLNNNRPFHARDSALTIYLEKIYQHSDCSLDSITPFTSLSDSIFNLSYIFHLTTTTDPNCISRGASDTLTLKLDSGWHNARYIYMRKKAPRVETIDNITTTTLSDTATLDSIIVVDGTINEYIARFYIDSNYNITSLNKAEYRAERNDALIEYDWKEATAIRYDAKYIDVSCSPAHDTISCTGSNLYTFDSLIVKTHTTISYDTITMSDIRSEYYKYVCIDTTKEEFTNTIDTILNDSIVNTYTSICDTAKRIDTTLAPIILDPNRDDTLRFYEQCIREEEITCPFKQVLFAIKNIDTTLYKENRKDTLGIFNTRMCSNGRELCRDEKLYDTTFADTSYYKITYNRSLAYMETKSACDSINYISPKNESIAKRKKIELYRELIQIDDPWCPNPERIDTLVWDIGRFHSIIKRDSLYEDSIPLWNKIIEEYILDTLDETTVKR